MFQNKKAFVQLAIPIILGLIVVGLVAYMIFVPKAPTYNQEQVTNLIEQSKQSTTTPIIDTPSEVRDNNPTTPPEESTPDNTPSPITTKCDITGQWEEIYVKGKSAYDFQGTNSPMVKAVGIFKYTGTCVADIYLEAGINPDTKQPLAAMPLISGAQFTTPSWCDANKNYYGYLWKGVKPNTKLIANFRPVTPYADGKYKMVVGAYTGCLSTKTTDKPISTTGKVIADNSYEIRISKSLYGETPTLETIEARQSWERVK